VARISRLGGFAKRAQTALSRAKRHCMPAHFALDLWRDDDDDDDDELIVQVAVPVGLPHRLQLLQLAA
jgi:hypothetical protein